MNTVGQYQYAENQRNFLEMSVIPLAIFSILDNKVHTLLVSDGLCQLMCSDRESVLRCLEYPIYDYVHRKDVAQLKQDCHSFFFGTSQLSTSFRVKLKGDKDFHNIFLSGKKISSEQGEPLFLMWYNDIEKYEKFNPEQVDEFHDFLKGRTNSLPFHTFGYQGYSVWNITKDILVLESGLGYFANLLGKDFGYRDYYSLNQGWLCETEDTDYFRELSPETITENFQKGVFPEEHIFTFGSSLGQISLKVMPSVTQSPETGDIYLKLQAENVTDNVVYETMLQSSAKTSEFMARIDGSAGSVYFVNTHEKLQDGYAKVPLTGMLPILSVNLGQEFHTSEELFAFIDKKCRNESNATIINRLSHDCIKSIRLEIVDKAERQYFICGSDVTSLMKMEVNSYYDALTGLPNMAAFRIIAQPAMEKMRSEDHVPALIYFDLRDMKAINEKYSFERGNGILIGTAYILRNVFTGYPVSRLAEDHFVVLTERVGVEQKIEAVHEQVLNNPVGIPIQICAGIYVDNGQTLDIAAACDRARLACKSLKGDYNRKYKIFDRQMFDEYHQRRHILTHFDEALEKEYIKVYYHPIVRTLTGNICDMEALSRWFDPEKGVLSPSKFIPVLEEHRLISKLDFYMVRKICENLDMQRRANLPLVPVSVNLSRIDFEMCDVVEEVLKIVDSYRVPHKLLTIEITESAFIHNEHFLKKQIDRFRAAGFDVWMDDFGSEYSSLNALQEFSFDFIKLDMKFMKDFSLTGKNVSILSYITGMASELGMHTLAEGVQTKEQLHFLRDIGCEKAQGYLFSRPMPCEYFLNKESRNAGLEYDDFSISQYYDKIGSIRLDNTLLSEYRINTNDMMVNVPAAVVEYRKGKFRILKANQSYKKFLNKIGFSEQYVDGEYCEWQKQPSKEYTRAAIKCLVTHSSERISNDMENGRRVSATLICISYNFITDVGAFITVVEKYF